MYHIEFDIAAVFVTLFILYYIIFRKGLSKHANRIYLCMLVLNLTAEFSDITAAVINNEPALGGLVIQYLSNYIYLAAHSILGFMLVIYLFYLIGYEKHEKAAQLMLSMPVFVILILLVTNPFHRKIFFIDENRNYAHGGLFFTLYVTAAAYMVFAIYLIIRHRLVLARARASALLFFILISFIPIIVQIVFPLYLFTMFFETMGLMGILFTIENKDDIINPTTGILNRYALQMAIDRVLQTSGNVLIIVKIPNLNYYNKMIGFSNMNDILQKIAKWLEKTCNRYSCYDCNRGHFAVLLEAVDDKTVNALKQKIIDQFEKPWGKGEFSLVFPLQIGVVHMPDDVKTMENLLMLIDAPFDGKTSTELDVVKAISDYERSVLIERLIDKALSNKSFQVYYQPIWDYNEGKVRSAEALCRLVDDEYGLISPNEFIPVSERNGAILEIGKLVFEKVCRFYQEGRLRKLGVDYIEVNLSVVQCMSKDLEDVFEKTLSKYSLNARHINLEITESATAGNQTILIDTIERLRSHGFEFSLDDYGTGYSNISYMYELPFSIIKIDKSILWKAIHPKTGRGQPNAVIYLENTVRMLKDMNYSVLVEGVETLEQKLFLEELECDYFQGYYFSKPVQEEVFLDYLKVVNA